MRLPRAKPAKVSPNADEKVVGYASALRVLVARDFLHSVKHSEQLMRANRKGAHEDILLFEKKFLSKTAKLGIPMFAHSIVRNEADQTKAFVQGFSKARYGESPHNFGLAVDFIHGIKGWNLDEQSWQMIGHIGREIAAQNGLKLVWGGDDPGVDDAFDWDPAHWELADWRRIKETY